MESIEQAWVVTDRMAKEARKAGLSVDEAVDILRSAKSVLNECHLNVQTRDELLPKANALITDAQKELFSASEPLGPEFAEKWTAELKRALKGEKIGEFTASVSSKFYANMPRNREWVRVAIPESVKEKVESIGEEVGVEMRPDGDSHVLIIGKKESIRRALDEMSPYFKAKKN